MTDFGIHGIYIRLKSDVLIIMERILCVEL